MIHDVALVWFRRDLRTTDQAALGHALASARRVYCVFVFDSTILDALPTRCDRRVDFIWQSLAELDQELATLGRQAGGSGGGLIVRHGDPTLLLPQLAVELGAGAVYVNRDYEPTAKQRDAIVAERLRAAGIGFESYKDQAIFDGDEVLTLAGRAFSIYTPYRNAWLRRLSQDPLPNYDSAPRAGALTVPAGSGRLPRLADIGFAPTDLDRLGIVPGMRGACHRLEDFLGRIDAYKSQRDYPAVKGPSYLSVHLRFGTISIRTLVAEAWRRWQHEASAGAGCWLNELIWRDFYFMILDRHPQLITACFRPEYDRLVWDDWPDGLAAWCEGRTGYPLVDAAMRQLNSSGYMHNRLRMVVASFLTKDLGIDWRCGERYFAGRLLDYDLAANNGGWQWAASTGCDAQPYFRIFNPVSQSKKFDPQGDFIRHYCPELARVAAPKIHAPWTLSESERGACKTMIGIDYPAPLVDHATARQRTLARFKAATGR